MTKPFVIKKSKDGQFYAIIRGENGEILYQSETETRKANIKKNIKAVCKIFHDWQYNLTGGIDIAIEDETKGGRR